MILFHLGDGIFHCQFFSVAEGSAERKEEHRRVEILVRRKGQKETGQEPQPFGHTQQESGQDKVGEY